MTKKDHRKISGREWENFGWRIGKFWLEKPFRRANVLKRS